MSDLCWLPIHQLAVMLRTREVSSVELTREYLERIADIDGSVHSYRQVFEDEALDAAAAADQAFARGAVASPLQGVPLGVKDLFAVGGIPCAAGSRLLRDNVPAADSAVVARLRAAGAVILGTQNMHELAFGVTGENPHDGTVPNPWDRGRIAGGSSSGTAAGVAAALCAGGVGTDTGGSVRIPAAYCGVAGLKPTYGSISREGVVPLAWTLDHVGPLARTTRDCGLLLAALMDPPASGWQPPLASPLATLDDGVHGLRVGLLKEAFGPTLQASVGDAVRAAGAELERLGAVLADASIPSFTAAPAIGTAIMGSEAATWHGDWLRDRASDYGSDVLARLRLGALEKATDYLRAQQARSRLQDEFQRAFESVDVLIAPTVALQPPEIGRTLEVIPWLGGPARGAINRLTVPANLAGIPALSIPCGFDDGMPIGLQILGRAYEDAVVLRAGRAFERATAWHEMRPPL